MNRYVVPSDEYSEPGSNNEVLKNHLNIKSKGIIEELEGQELKRTELKLLDIFHEDQQFKVEDICNIHELWLGDLYLSAGKYRTVTLSKNNFSILCLLIELKMKKVLMNIFWLSKQLWIEITI